MVGAPRHPRVARARTNVNRTSRSRTDVRAGREHRPGEPAGTLRRAAGAARAEGQVTRSERAAALAPVVGAVQFIAAWVVLAAVRPDHDPLRDAISTLAAREAAHRGVLASSLVLFGLLIGASIPVVRRALAPHGRPVVAMIALNAIGSVAVAALPCTAGCPGAAESTQDMAHFSAAIVSYVGLAGAPLVTGWTLRRLGARPALARTSLVFGTLVAACLVVLLTQAAGEYGGAVQRAATTIGDLWYVVLAAAILRADGQLVAGRPDGRARADDGVDQPPGELTPGAGSGTG